ncbi:hypothetical protein BD560DRAFT_382345 [Blakeslea trispora]|nr:hypothetical protein BD560DRAFT_382345 [Blakeslea trispora]
MPRYCKYCHAEGHSVADCEKRKTKFTCWTCGVAGHMAASCPKDAPQKKPRAKAPVATSFDFEWPKDNPVLGSKRPRHGHPSKTTVPIDTKLLSSSKLPSQPSVPVTSPISTASQQKLPSPETVASPTEPLDDVPTQDPASSWSWDADVAMNVDDLDTPVLDSELPSSPLAMTNGPSGGTPTSNRQ